MRRIYPSYQFAAPLGAPFFLHLARLLLVGLFSINTALATEDVAERLASGADFQSAHEALIEAIEAEGLVVSAVIPFNAMLARTAGDLAKGKSPFANAEIVQFCSSLVAWQLLEEDVAQIALCPLSIAVLATTAEPGKVKFAYRLPGKGSAGRLRAEKLLARLVDRAAQLARQRW